MKSIGLDIGTTSICAVAVECDTGALEKTAALDNDAALPSANSWERIQEPGRIEQLVFDVLDQVWGEDVASIGVTGQMHGIVYTGHGGAVSPLSTWQDGRGNLPYQDTTYADFLGSHTGYGNVTDFYNRVNGRVPEGADAFCTIHDYIVMRLTERSVPVIHASDAASFGCYDLLKHRFTIDNKMLPAVTAQAETVGHYRGVPVAVAIGDNQASFIGAGGGGDAVLVNVGTGSQVSLMADEGVLPHMAKGSLELRPLYGDSYLLAGSALCGGRAYALLEQFFREVVYMAGGKPCGKLYEEMARLLEEGEETDLVFTNRFCGTREDPAAHARIANLSLTNFTPRDFIAGCLHGIADELYDLYSAAPRRCGRLLGSGNGIRRNPALVRMFEKRFQMKMQIPSHQEEAAVGAALFSMAAAGFYQISELEGMIQYVL